MISQREKSAQKTDVSFKWLKNALTTSILVLVLSAEPTASVTEPGTECGGPLSYTPFSCIPTAIDYFNRCMFPIDKLNAAGILNSCPRLSAANPLNNDGSLNLAALNTTITALNECLATTRTICGVTVASTPIAPVQWVLDSLFPASWPINGSCTLNPNGGFVNHLQQTVFSLPAQQSAKGAVSLSFKNPNITQECTWNCTLSISTSLLNLGMLQPGQIQLFDFPEMHGITYISINPTLSIDLTGTQPAFTVVHDVSDVKVSLSNFVSCTLKLPQVIVDTMNLAINTFFQQSTTNAYATNFLATLATQAIKAAIPNSC